MIRKRTKNILEELPAVERSLRELREVFLSNLIMIGEVPSPTFQENRRVEVMIDRLSTCGLQSCSSDEAGNALGIIPGATEERNILIAANVDTVFPDTVDHTISMNMDTVTGPGLSDNAVGLALLASLPVFLEHLGITFESNVVLMGAARSLGRGNNEGLQFFLDNTDLPITAGICLEGVHLGRLSHSSIGMMRGEINCEVPEGYDWTRFGAEGAIDLLHDIISGIESLPLPSSPKTSVVLGSIRAGHTFNEIARTGVLRFEIRSESKEMVEHIHHTISDLVEEASMKAGTRITLEKIAERSPGGIPFSHPLVRSAHGAMKVLGVEPRSMPSSSELAVFIAREIPAIVVGITDGSKLNERDEQMLIDPIFRGAAQIIGILQAIDRGFDNE